MNKMCFAYIGVLLLVLQLSSQIVVAQTTSATSTNSTNSTSETATMPESEVNPTTVASTTANQTKGASGRNDAFTLLLPMALTASLLHSWS